MSHWGGSLHKDIKDLAEDERHMDIKTRKNGIHDAEIETNSLLFQITGKRILRVNSLHHQSIKKPGTD